MRVLFVAYQEASNPLMIYSQGFPYIFGLSKMGINFSVLTYETSSSFFHSKRLSSETIAPFKWYFLYFNKNRGVSFTILDIIRGALKVVFIIIKDEIEIVHARGLIAALISFLPVKILRRKFIFDTRGLLADKYASANLVVRDGVIYRIMKIMEKFLLKRCDFFTLETNKHSEIINTELPCLSYRKKVVPCCVDLSFFKYKEETSSPIKEISIVYLGKSGTWHKVEEMFDFFKVAIEEAKAVSFSFLTQEDPDYILHLGRQKNIDLSKFRVVNPRRSDLPFLLSGAKVGIMFIEPQDGYNSSHIKFGEYLACGLPVIVNSGIGDTDTIIEEEKVGVIVDAFSEFEYKKAIYKLQGLLSEGESLRQRCRAVAEKYFSLDGGIRKYLEIYERLKKDEGTILGSVSYAGSKQ